MQVSRMVLLCLLLSASLLGTRFLRGLQAGYPLFTGYPVTGLSVLGMSVNLIDCNNSLK